MLIHKNKIMFISLAVLVIAAFMVFAEQSPEIDISQLRQANPFAQFAGVGAPAAVAQKPRPEGPKPDLFIETVSLKFVDAKSLKNSITNMSSEWGNMEPDAKGNSMIICDTNENLPKILAQIRKIDQKPAQIMIEVVILDVKLNNGTEIGINWDMLTNDYRDAAFRQNLSFTSRVGAVAPDTDTIGNATAYNSTNKGSDFWLMFGDIRNVIHVLQEKNNVEILASPRVMVVSGQKASIEAVEEIPYQEQTDTSAGGTLTSIQFKNVGVTLNVGATLTDDKFIFLDVEADQKVRTGTAVVVGTGGTSSSVPVVDARVVKSSLLLNDGQILVIGGLRRKDTQKQTNQIPFLGDIPWVGLAFQSTQTVQNNSELLVILSPHIYNGEKPSDAEMAKYNEIIKRPLIEIPENERQKDTNTKDKENKKAKKSKKQQKSNNDVG